MYAKKPASFTQLQFAMDLADYRGSSCVHFFHVIKMNTRTLWSKRDVFKQKSFHPAKFDNFKDGHCVSTKVSVCSFISRDKNEHTNYLGNPPGP